MAPDSPPFPFTTSTQPRSPTSPLAKFKEAWDPVLDDAGRIAAILDFGALVLLRQWEMSGLLEHLRAALLYAQVVHIWNNEVAVEGRHFLDADILFRYDDEDEFVDHLAEFIWRHRTSALPVTQTDRCWRRKARPDR